MCDSISVVAGLVDQSMPCWANPADTSSPRMAGNDESPGKYANQLGDCQCVMPGITTRSRSAITSVNGSGSSGANSGSMARMAPGSTSGVTGRDSTCS